MDDKTLQKRISETVFDIFPLDRLLPLETVYHIFIQEYNKINKKSVFRDDLKFQRLREGYFSLFVAASFCDMNKKPYYLVFPSDPSNDVYVARVRNEAKPDFEAYPFDVKEYTEYSDSFANFVDKKIVNKLNIYNLIIASYKHMDGNDLKYLVDCIKTKAPNTKVWITGNSTDDKDHTDIAKVTVVNKEGIVYNKEINLNDWLDRTQSPMIYQDVVRLK